MTFHFGSRIYYVNNWSNETKEDETFSRIFNSFQSKVQIAGFPPNSQNSLFVYYTLHCKLVVFKNKRKMRTTYLKFGISSKWPQQRVHKPFRNIGFELLIRDGEVGVLTVVTQNVPENRDFVIIYLAVPHRNKFIYWF